MGWFEIFWWIPSWLWILFCVLGLLYYYGNQPYSTFTKLGIPGPKPQLFVGNAKQMLSKGMVSILQKWGEEYGSVFGIYFGRKPRLVISDLDILKEILVKDFQHFTDREVLLSGKIISNGLFFQGGKNWKRIRNILTPTFSSGKLKLMFSSILDCGKLLANNFEVKARKGETIDVKHDYGAYTMDVIARTAFGIDIDSQTNPDEPFVQFARKLFRPSPLVFITFLLASAFPVLVNVFRYMNISFFPNVAVQFFIKSIQDMVEQRKKEFDSSNTKRADFLQLLLDAESTEQNGDDSQDVKVKRLSADEILGQAFLFFIAGYETTASTLQYVTYILAKYPHIQDKVVEEINTEIADREVTYDDLSKLVYLEHVIQETLRMYPPVHNINRVSSENVTIRGVTIPKNCAVMIPIYSIHHNPDIYKNPTEFIPERFANKNLNPLTFLPFGYGPRLCIGLRLAMIEAKVALVTALQKIRFVKHEKSQDTLEFVSLGVLTPSEPIIVGVELRNQS